jgi:hypothetical protein
LVPVPPGMSRTLRGLPSASQTALAEAYPKYTAALQHLLDTATKDVRYGKRFRRTADVERALFASGRAAAAAAANAPQGAAGTRAVGRSRRVAGAALVGALPGAVTDARALLQGDLSPRDFLRKRGGEAGLAGISHVVGNQVQRFGKATTGVGVHLQGGARAAAEVARFVVELRRRSHRGCGG